MSLRDRIGDLLAVARAMLRPEEQIGEPVIVPGPLLQQHLDARNRVRAQADERRRALELEMARAEEQDHVQADPDPRRGADDRGGDPAAAPDEAAAMIAPHVIAHVIAPCPICGAPARTGAVHYASVTEQRPCPASWKGPRA